MDVCREDVSSGIGFEMSDQSARQFMWVYSRFGDENQKVFEFRQSVIYALSAPSTPDAVVDKAIEKAESGEKVTTEWVKEQKRLEAALAVERQRSEEWREQSNDQRKKIRELQEQNDLLQTREPEIQVQIQTPAAASSCSYH